MDRAHRINSTDSEIRMENHLEMRGWPKGTRAVLLFFTRGKHTPL